MCRAAAVTALCFLQAILLPEVDMERHRLSLHERNHSHAPDASPASDR